MSEQTPDLGAMVSKLLGNPELISQIASTVGMDAPKSEEKVDGEATPSGSIPSIEAILPMLSSSGGGKGGASKRCALLSALKPFCNEHRCRTIDYMIGISRLSETLIPTKRG
jgi:hypothetical protein